MDAQQAIKLFGYCLMILAALCIAHHIGYKDGFDDGATALYEAAERYERELKDRERGDVGGEDDG